jgi:hypothetical protein
MKEHAISWYVFFFMNVWDIGEMVMCSSVFFLIFIYFLFLIFFCFCHSLSIIIALDKKKLKINNINHILRSHLIFYVFNWNDFLIRYQSFFYQTNLNLIILILFNKIDYKIVMSLCKFRIKLFLIYEYVLENNINYIIKDDLTV